MAFKSGRTLDQGMRACVIEGRKLYVHPQRFSLMQEEIMKADDPDEGARRALEAAGVLRDEIVAAERIGFEVIVDYELKR